MLNSQLLFDVYLKLPYEEIVKHSIISRQINSILNDPVFWKRMVYRDFGYTAAEMCYDGDWKQYYEICEKLEPRSIHNIRFWGEKDRWGKIRYDSTAFFIKTIKENNVRRIELYFKLGCNEVVQDEEYMRLLRWLYTSKDPRDYFAGWFWKLVEKIKFPKPVLWQHVANDMQMMLVGSERSEDDCDDKIRPNINDVVNLIRKSKQLPLSFLYETLGSSQDIEYCDAFFHEFPEPAKCNVVTPGRCYRTALKVDCYFFSGMAKMSNICLLKQYLEKCANVDLNQDTLNTSGETANPLKKIEIRPILHMLLGCIQHDKIAFLRCLKEKVPSLVTPERILWVCKLFTTPPVRIVNFALCCSLRDDGTSWDSIQDSVSLLMEIMLDTYRILRPESIMKFKIEAVISLLLDWGYDNYLKVIESTRRLTPIFYERLQSYLSLEELRTLE